jgi:hypothetical protein
VGFRFAGTFEHSLRRRLGKISEKELQEVRKRLNDQVALRMLSCITLAAKLHSDPNTQVSKVI